MLVVAVLGFVRGLGTDLTSRGEVPLELGICFWIWDGGSGLPEFCATLAAHYFRQIVSSRACPETSESVDSLLRHSQILDAIGGVAIWSQNRAFVSATSSGPKPREMRTF